jgi:hypothetical protein
MTASLLVKKLLSARLELATFTREVFKDLAFTVPPKTLKMKAVYIEKYKYARKNNEE